MSTLPPLTQSARLVLLFSAALLVPLSARAQAVLSVSPTSVSVQANAGTNVASQTVRVSNAGRGALKWSVVAPTAGWLSVSPTQGVNSGSITLTFRTSALAAGPYQTSFRVESTTGSAITVGVQATLTASSSAPPPPGQLTVTCPANISVASSNGSPVVVTYSASTSGGVAPMTVTGTPASGSSFPVGTTPVQVTARSSDGQTASCGFSVTVTYSPAPAPSGFGPSSTITCPSGAVDIWPGASIQTAVNQLAGSTTFCIRAGTHSVRSAITPKTGDTFVGEYGAILDGTGWTTSDTNQAAFRAHNQDIDDVTIRNLVIRNMPQRGIHAFYWTSRIAGRSSTTRLPPTLNRASSSPNNSVIRNNYIHHNTVRLATSGLSAYVGTTFEGNEIAYNGREQKVVESDNVTFRNNFVHHNVGDGIWYDARQHGRAHRRQPRGGQRPHRHLLRDQQRRHHPQQHRPAERGHRASSSRRPRTCRFTATRSTTISVASPTSSTAPSMGQGTIGFDLANNSAHDNTITVGHAERRVRERLQLSVRLHRDPGGAVSERLEEPDLLRNTYTVPTMTPDGGSGTRRPQILE